MITKNIVATASAIIPIIFGESLPVHTANAPKIIIRTNGRMLRTLSPGLQTTRSILPNSPGGYCCHEWHVGLQPVDAGAVDTAQRSLGPRPDSAPCQQLNREDSLRRFFLRVDCVFFVRPLEVFDVSALEMPDPSGHFL